MKIFCYIELDKKHADVFESKVLDKTGDSIKLDINKIIPMPKNLAPGTEHIWMSVHWGVTTIFDEKALITDEFYRMTFFVESQLPFFIDNLAKLLHEEGITRIEYGYMAKDVGIVCNVIRYFTSENGLLLSEALTNFPEARALAKKKLGLTEKDFN